MTSLGMDIKRSIFMNVLPDSLDFILMDIEWPSRWRFPTWWRLLCGAPSEIWLWLLTHSQPQQQLPQGKLPKVSQGQATSYTVNSYIPLTSQCHTTHPWQSRTSTSQPNPSSLVPSPPSLASVQRSLVGRVLLFFIGSIATLHDNWTTFELATSGCSQDHTQTTAMAKTRLGALQMRIWCWPVNCSTLLSIATNSFSLDLGRQHPVDREAFSKREPFPVNNQTQATV